jgi:hypothetical protein
MRQLAIVGTGSKTRDQAPWNDLDFDIWVFNEAPLLPWCKRFDASFQIHEPEIYSGVNYKAAKYWEWLQEAHGKPVYMQEDDPRIPDCRRYPLVDAIALCGERYLQSTAAYMLALAALHGYGEVHIYGIELSATEYQYQAENLRFWIGFLKGRIGADNVHIHSGRYMFEAPLYGYEGSFSFGPAYFQERVTYWDNTWQAGEKHLKNIRSLVARCLKNKEYAKLPIVVTSLEKASRDVGLAAGAQGQAEKYASYGDLFSDRNEFEKNAAIAQGEGETKRVLMYHTGGMIEYVGNVWAQTKNDRAAQQLATMLDRLEAQAYELGAMEGVFSENQTYIHKYDAAALANGGKFLTEIPGAVKLAMEMVKA